MLPLLVYNQLRESINKLTTIKDKGVTMPDCGSECRRFESGLPPNKNPCKLNTYEDFLLSGNRHLREQIMLNPT